MYATHGTFKCLQPYAGSSSNGTVIVQRTCNGSSSQRIGAVDLLNGYYALVFLSSNKCMNVENAANWAGAQMIIWDCTVTNGSFQWNQQFSGPFTAGTVQMHYTRAASPEYNPGCSLYSSCGAWIAISGASVADDAPLIQWYYQNMDHYKFVKW
jgi:hypothetical protein